MEISIVGLGYVGTVSAACLAAAGNTVWGVDINPEKVRAINEGRAPIVEPNLNELIAEGHNARRLHATGDLCEALAKTELTFLAVATPSRANGDIDAAHLVGAANCLIPQLRIAFGCARTQNSCERVLPLMTLSILHSHCSVWSTMKWKGRCEHSIRRFLLPSLFCLQRRPSS